MPDTERESSLAERERKDAEKAAENKARQERLGHVEKTEKVEKPKPQHKTKAKDKEAEPEA
jgi:hypothetical protein